MAGLKALPREVLHDIVSQLSLRFADLRNCSLACRALWEVATAALYHRLDLSIDERDDPDADAKTKRRQLRVLRSISENPKLGAFVQVFKNHNNALGTFEDATCDADSSMLISAAENMKNLSRASLTPNQVAAHIVTTLQSYPQLVYLSVCGLKPEENVWSMAPTSLTTLKWEIPYGGSQRDQRPWDSARFLLNVVEATCRGLESLDISVYNMRRPPPNPPLVIPDRAQQYREAQSTTQKLAHLRHFGFRDRQSSVDQSESEGSLLDLVNRYRESLKSISISIPIQSHNSWGRASLDFILRVCRLLPDLNDLTLDETRAGGNNGTGAEMTSYDFFYELTTNIASPEFSIERFSVFNSYCPFSPAIGKLFGSWTSLKFLRVGDGDNTSGPYGDDGRIDFAAYKPDLLDFIKELPQSLEELYLEVNGEDLMLDEDEDFDPVCDLGIGIFKSLRRLHTCDIHAWISNVDGGLGEHPEKAVFYRRLAHQSREDSKGSGRAQSSKIKDVWTLRMDTPYQSDDSIFAKKREVVELEAHEGEFEGRDANDVWCDGLMFARRGSGDSSDYSWPFWVDKLRSYPMFRKAL